MTKLEKAEAGHRGRASALADAVQSSERELLASRNEKTRQTRDAVRLPWHMILDLMQ